MSSTTSDSEPSGSDQDGSGSALRSSSSDTSDSGSSDDIQTGQSGSSDVPHSGNSDEAPTSMGQEGGFDAVFQVMKSNAALWQQFGILASQLGMTTDLFEKYLCMIVKNVATNPDIKAQLSSQTGGQAETNQGLMNQLLAVAAMQQAMNPLLIAQFLAANCQNPQVLLPGVAVSITGQSDVQEERPEHTPERISEDRSWSCGRKARLEEILKYEVQHDGEIDDFFRAGYSIELWLDQYEKARGNSPYIDRVGDLNFSEEKLINIACWPPWFKDHKLQGYPEIDEMRQARQPALFTRKTLGVFPRSLKRFVLSETRAQHRIVFPPSSEDDPIVGSIKLRALRKSTKEIKLFLDGTDTVMKAKKKRDSIFENGLGNGLCEGRKMCHVFMYVSRIRFLDPVFPVFRRWRASRWATGDYFGPVYFMACKFDKPLMLHSDAWLFDCKGIELTLFEGTCAHCVRCDFDRVQVLGGCIIAQESHFGTLQLGERQARPTDPFKEKFYKGDWSHFTLDRCVVDKGEVIQDSRMPAEIEFWSVTNWTSNYAEPRTKLEKLFRRKGWPGVCSPERYILRTLKLCSSCLHNPQCIFCGAPVRQTDKIASICQFCAPSSDVGLSMVRCCVRCLKETTLVAHARVCETCGKNIYPHYCMHCGASHGEVVNWKYAPE